MNIEEVKKLVPEQTQAAIELLKKGTFARSIISTILRAVIYMIIGAFLFGEIKIRVEVIEAGILQTQKKIDTVIENQSTDRADMQELKNELSNVEDFIGYKKK